MRYMLAALALGLVLGLIIQEYVSSQRLPALPGMVPVVVSKFDLPAGSVLKPEFLRVVHWPQEVHPTQAAETVQQVAGRLVLAPVAKGEPILLNKLAPLARPKDSQKTEKKVQVTLNMLNYPFRFIEDQLGLVDRIHQVYKICTFQE
jgi:Flp pilus assembly protein CpaB